MRVTVGADPEFFLKDSKGVNVAAVGLVPGTKVKPHPLVKGAVQLDGTAVEFNIRPALTQLGFVTNIKSTLRGVRRIVPKEFSFDYSPTVTYSKKYFDTLPDDCKVLGCDPDFDAYNNGKANTPPDNKTTMRTGAGHIHVGWGKGLNGDDHLWDCCMVTQLMDHFIGTYSLIWDKDRKRQNMYGRPGCFRPKPYGMEYRTPSNAWLRFPKLWPWLHATAKLIPSLAEDGLVPNKAFTYRNHKENLDFYYKYPHYWGKYFTDREAVDMTQREITRWYGKELFGRLPVFPVDFKE